MRLVAVLLLALVAVALAPLSPVAQADGLGLVGSGWPPVSQATIRPGVELDIGENQCTANFVFQSPSNDTLYLGMAAHCAAHGGSTQTNGCETTSRPLGALVTITGASKPGVLDYSAWLAMQAAGELDPYACAYNDFALVRIDAADRHLVHPAMIYYGGPTGMAPANPAPGQAVMTYGASDTRPEVDDVDRREGRVLSNAGNGWSTSVFTATPGIPGDSGSGVLLGSGEALGSLATVSLAPVPASNGVTTLERALPYAAQSGVVVQLATWPLLAQGLTPV